MVNRVSAYFGEPPYEPPEVDYWEVYGDAGWFAVSPETARVLVRQLARVRPPRWLRFRDLFGSEVRIRSRQVGTITEATTAQRAAARQFRRERQREEKEDRRWEEE